LVPMVLVLPTTISVILLIAVLVDKAIHGLGPPAAT